MTSAAARAFAVPAIATLLASCAAFDGSNDLPSLDGTSWVLADLTGRTLVDGARPTLQFDGDRVSGTDGCNRYSGRYAVTREAFKVVPPLASTRMACSAEVNEQAQVYLDALGVAGSYQLNDGRLLLLAASGTPVATFEPER